MNIYELKKTYILCRLQEPLLGRGGVGDSLLRRERLGRDDEEGRLGVQLLQGLGHVGAVNVGDEVNVGADLASMLQNFYRRSGQ